MSLVVLSGFFLALAAPLIHRVTGRWAGWILSLGPFAIAGALLGYLPETLAGNTIRVSHAWVPFLGLNLSLTLDGLSLLFALLISLLGGLILIYAGGYMAGKPRAGAFSAWILAFMASMLGVVLSDNLIVLFIFWELTSFTSYFLIGHEHGRPAARQAALKALIVTGTGGLALLAGFLLMGLVAGGLGVGDPLEISRITESAAGVRAHALYPAILLLVLLGAFTKSAQFPFHFWLPAAMEAPTPASAYLHAATMVKAGVYLLARLQPTLGGTDLWYVLVAGAGAVTMVMGAWFALLRTDLKQVLAYTTISALGILVMLLGLGTGKAATAAMIFLLAHAMYKGTLFLVAGGVDHSVKTREIWSLGGLAKVMPLTALASLVAAASMAGLPPLVGFLAKEVFYEAAVKAPIAGFLLAAAAVATGTAMFAAAFLAGVRPFLSRAVAFPHAPHESPPSLLLGPLVLGLGGLGVWAGGPHLRGLIDQAAMAISSEAAPAHWVLWHGFNTAVAMSLISLAAGILLCFALGPMRRAGEALAPAMRFGPERAYDVSLEQLTTGAESLTRFIQNGYLRIYLMVILLCAAALSGAFLVLAGAIRWPGVGDVRFWEVVVAALIAAAAIMAVRTQSRFAAIAAMGVAGYGIALIFILFSAPDLAMTQLIVETLTVILFALVFYHLPRFKQLSTPAELRKSAIVAAVAGLFMTALTLAALQVQIAEPISRWFGEASLTRAHGRNVVNVILVDFRGLDTLGEITVVAISAVGVYALLRRHGPGKESP